MSIIVCSNCNYSFNKDSESCLNCGFKLKVNQYLYTLSLLIAPILVIAISSLQIFSLNLLVKNSFYIALSIESLISPMLTTIILYIFVKKSIINVQRNKLFKFYILVFVGEMIGYFSQVLVIEPVLIDPILNTGQGSFGNSLNLSIMNSTFIFISSFQFIAILSFVLYLVELKNHKMIKKIPQKLDFEFFTFLFILGMLPSFLEILENEIFNTMLKGFTSNVYNFILINNLFYILSLILILAMEFLYLEKIKMKNLTYTIQHLILVFITIYLGSMLGDMINWTIGPLNQFLFLLELNWDGPFYVIISSIITAFSLTSYLVFLIFFKNISNESTQS